MRWKTDEVGKMNGTYNPKLTATAQKLRKNMTGEERRLWYDFLKGLPFVFNRQKVIGNYIVDFYCAGVKLVIELDGSQHYDEKGIQSDVNRDEYLRSLGLTVKRYSNADINKRFDSVCEDIFRFVACNRA
jgi:very-short-patch-repair endonuclease